MTERCTSRQSNEDKGDMHDCIYLHSSAGKIFYQQKISFLLSRISQPGRKRFQWKDMNLPFFYFFTYLRSSVVHTVCSFSLSDGGKSFFLGLKSHFLSVSLNYSE